MRAPTLEAAYQKARVDRQKAKTDRLQRMLRAATSGEVFWVVVCSVCGIYAAEKTRAACQTWDRCSFDPFDPKHGKPHVLTYHRARRLS
jgi:hypothetical protein